ncbi:WPP domain-associated protein [Striga hermonthica]|uniref:WPP domain-associated protein n=1 Tax=Striga hermonthica TaxID=68872 RepID=A0A9N7N673_STRHE|nr:WPP domain-associated protein [Striga hermonthica]
MESQEVMVHHGVSNGDSVVVANGNGLEHQYNENGTAHVAVDEEEKGEIADVLLEGFEEYWDDINDRLVVSRMVSDSVIKGMVFAVEQESAERIAVKEMELACLKEYFRSSKMVAGKFDVKLPFGTKSFETGKNGRFQCVADFCSKHERMREELVALRVLADEQFMKAKKEVGCARGGNYMKKVGSGSELLGLGGILQEKNWMCVDKMLESLSTAINSVCSKMEDLLLSSEASLCESHHDMEILTTLEDIVMQSVIRSLQEENLLEPNAHLHVIQAVNCLEKFNDISGLVTRLDGIQQSLSAHETMLVSQDLDHLHQKGFVNHVSPRASFCGENGTFDESIIHVVESYDFQQLNHMEKEELVDHFNDIITKLKRDHESVLARETEKYFSMRREYLNLKERGSPVTVTHKKDEELDVLRRKIPEIISKLENFLVENERFPALLQNFESVEKLKLRLDSLLLENCRLRNSVNDRENEVKCLKAQILGAAEELLHHSLAEENMLKLVENLKSAVDDSRIETSFAEEVYNFVLREQFAQMRCNSEDSGLELLMAHEAETANRDEIEDSDIESYLIQGLSGLILTEAIIGAERLINDLHKEALIDKQMRICLETEAREKENEFLLEVEENEKLKQDIQDLRTALQDQEKLAMDLSFPWSKERAEFELASRELSNLRQHASCLEAMVTESNRDLELWKSQCFEAMEQIEVNKMEMCKLQQELDQTKEHLAEFELDSRELSNLRQHASCLEAMVTESNRDLELWKSQCFEAMEQIEVNKMEMCKLQQELDQTKEHLTETKKERDNAVTLTQELHDKFVLSEFRDEKLKKETELAVSELLNLFNDFEWRISGAFQKNSLRFEDTTSHLKALTKMVTDLRRRELMYKQRLDLKTANLHKAEAEVDVLGDEVDDLLKLLNKIFIALDHYSPVLKHYPGIIEILELVRRELRGDSTVLL